MTILFSILTLVPWVLATGLIYLLIQIARFYQKKYAELYQGSPDQRTYYAVLWVPVLLFLIATGRYILSGDSVGDPIGEGAFFVGGIVLAILAYRLQQLMTGDRQ
jgi:hypothetical protein